jgi:hypothetical protein
LGPCGPIGDSDSAARDVPRADVRGEENKVGKGRADKQEWKRNKKLKKKFWEESFA